MDLFLPGTDCPDLYQANSWIVTDTMAYKINDGIEFKNIFGYDDINNVGGLDADGTPYTIASGIITTGARALSDEIQTLGTVASDRLTYVGGFYYSSESTSFLEQQQFFAIFSAPFGTPPGSGTSNDFLTNKTYAGYAQATYKLNDSRLSVTGGLRYTSEKVGKQTLEGDGSRMALVS